MLSHKMKIDFKSQILEYFVNNKSEGIAIDNIKIGDNIKYKLGIILYDNNVGVELIDFRHQCHKN